MKTRKLIVVNFGNKAFNEQKKWNIFSARILGKANKVISYSPKDIEGYLDTYQQFKKYYNKGFGNYFWKPYVILKAIESIEENDYLFYCDCGTLVIRNLISLCNYLEQFADKDILAFRLPLVEKQWTKRDTFVLMDADKKEYTDTSQILATYFLIRKTKASIEFLKSYQKCCIDERIVSDLPNTMGNDNYPDFVAHRHDQSVFSILSKKSNIVRIERDISDYGKFPEKYLQTPGRLKSDEYFEQEKNLKVFLLSNRKEKPLKYLIKYILKSIIKK